jgi:myo-inositol-1(or 4)-monophosphatase
MLANSDKLEVAMAAAVAAGNELIGWDAGFSNFSVKESLRDIVTDVDINAETRVIDILQKRDPGCQILTEEQGFILEGEQEDYWVVDALDGTVNFVNRIPFYCSSIAYMEKGKPIIGAIYNPILGNLYYGAEGIGVFCNEARIKIKNSKPEESLFSVTFSGKDYDPKNREKEFLMFEKINETSRGCLRTGSAAINLSYVAEGRFAGCWGKANYLWDVAAGLLFAQIAGANVEYRYLDSEKFLISYIVAVPSAWEYMRSNVELWQS